MTIAVRQTVCIKAGGMIEVSSPELHEGHTAEVIVLVEGPVSAKPTMLDMIGAGKGTFASPVEVDKFIRAERDSWDS